MKYIETTSMSHYSWCRLQRSFDFPLLSRVRIHLWEDILITWAIITL